MTKEEFAPVTPGEMLQEEFLAEYGLSQNQLAKAIGKPKRRGSDAQTKEGRAWLRNSRRFIPVKSFARNF